MTIRSKKILESARDEVCTLCGRGDGTVVAAHSNLIEDGRGIGHKTHDVFIAYLCHACHYDMDYGTASKLDKYVDFHRAMKRTWLRLIDKGIISIK